MKQAGSKSIIAIRTFNDDVLRARGQTVTHAPKVRKKISAQELTDTLLKDTIKEHSAEDFIGTTDGDYIPMESAVTHTSSTKTETRSKEKKVPTPNKKKPPTADNITKHKKLKKNNALKKASMNTKQVSVKKIQTPPATLTEDIEKITSTDAPLTSGTAFDVSSDNVQDGTIITNKKRKRFRLLPALGKSIKSWFTHTKKELMEEKLPEHTVASATSRLEVIKEAARASKHAPSDDHGIVIKKLKKKRKKKTNTTPLTVKQKKEVSAPTWASAQETSNEDNSQPISHPKIIDNSLDISKEISDNVITQEKQENASEKNILQDEEKVSLPTSETQQKIETKETIKTSTLKKQNVTEHTHRNRTQQSTDISIFTKNQITHSVAPQETKEAPTETPVLEKAYTGQSQEQDIQTTHTSTEEKNNTPTSSKPNTKKERLRTKPQTSPTSPNSPTTVPHKKRTFRAAPSDTPRIPIYMYLGVIAIASLIGIGVTVYWFASSTSTEDAVVLRIPTLFTTQQQIAIELPNDQETFLSTLLDQTITTRETIQIYPARTDENGIRVPASTKEILTVLAWRAPGSFTRSITDITFGSYNGTSPFILLKATDFDTTFAGLLEWEPDMSTDLSPLFGPPVTRSFDPYARTDTQIRSAFFRDAIINNKSARVLVDSQDNERLVYVFVTPQIVLIAPDTSTITAILPVVTQ